MGGRLGSTGKGAEKRRCAMTGEKRCLPSLLVKYCISEGGCWPLWESCRPAAVGLFSKPLLRLSSVPGVDFSLIWGMGREGFCRPDI